MTEGMDAMVSQCANPDCMQKLHYLREGKIYRFEMSTETGARRLEHFWLCSDCSKSMTLTRVSQREIMIEHRREADPGRTA